MKALKTSNKGLKKEAEKNTSVSKKSSGTVTTIKEGVPLDHATKLEPAGHAKFGMKTLGASLGATLNMDNYESMRIDCWLSDEVQEGESYADAYARVFAILEETVQQYSAQYKV